jgi:hypothetical protein
MDKKLKLNLFSKEKIFYQWFSTFLSLRHTNLKKSLAAQSNVKKDENVCKFFLNSAAHLGVAKYRLRNNDLDQRCPTHSPLATCGEWLF